MKKIFFLFFFSLSLTTCQQQKELLLHVPSPSWEDQIVYFIMTDRFYDGNPNNNELGMGEYDPTKESHYHGGDLAGIQQQLDYIETLGATAIWITPPVWNQWWNPEKNFTGYHGYWGSHFEKVDPHYGNLEEYQKLSDALHRRGMYLIQDVVTNHVGDYIRYEGGYDSTDVTRYYVNYGQPEQSPFDLNDPRDASHIEAAVYHFTPEIPDFKDPTVRLTHQLSNLDDLNTTNPKVIETLIKSYQYWIETVGVDGYRFDTAIYVDHEFWHRFVHGGIGELEGMVPFAKHTGREAFYTFGEAWISAPAGSDEAEKEIQTYLGSTERPEMDALLNFPLQQSIKRVFGDGEPTANMTYRLATLQQHFPNPSSMVNFMDNHDMTRFRSVASEASYQQGMLFMMTMPGMPVIYQGTEQGEKEVRAPLFQKLDSKSDPFLFLQKMIAFRKREPLTRKGKISVIMDSDDCPGLLLYKMEKSGESLFAVFNTTEFPLVTSGVLLSTNESINDITEVLSLQEGSELKVEKGNLEYLSLAPKEGLVFKLKEGPAKSLTEHDLQVFNPMGVRVKNSNLTLSGTVSAADSAFVLVDGNYRQRLPIDVSSQNWKTVLALDNLMNGKHFWQAIAYKGTDLILSKKIPFKLELPELENVLVTDPVGDDKGPTGAYEYPSDPSFAGRTMDVKKVTAFTTGNNLRLDIEMAAPLSTVWRPFNEFDHLLLMGFVDLPEQKGTKVLPYMNMILPEDEEWDYGWMVNGWSMSMFRSEGTGSDHLGRAITQKPLLTTIPSQNTIQLILPAEILDNPVDLKGTKIRLYTWDGSGDEDGLRPLAPKSAGYTFGGGAEDDPKYMDFVELVLQ